MSELALSNSYADSSENPGKFSGILSLFKSSRELEKTAADIFDPIVSISRKAKKYPLWNVRTDDVPLSVDVRYENGFWFAELEWLNVHSEGASIYEAIQNLEKHIDHFIEYYADLDGDLLTEYALELQKRFSKVERI